MAEASMTRWSNPRCGDCGLFTSWDCDWETAWGGACQYEPDDPEAICNKCSQKRYEKYLAHFIAKGLCHNDRRPSWHSPECWYRARAVVRGMRKHGLALPVRHELVREDWGHMRPEWEHKGVRAWCACGWSTGWLDAAYNADIQWRDVFGAHLDAHKEAMAA